MTLTPVHVFLVVSAVWRLSSLFANEDGPFLIFKKIRSRARDLTRSNRFFLRMRFSKGLECEWCNSVWFASALVPLWYVFGDTIVIVLSPLAISTWAIAIKYIIQKLEK